MAENFSYKFLKLKIPPSLPGKEDYEHLKKTVQENLSDWFLTPWFSDWFGEEVFTFEHLKKTVQENLSDWFLTPWFSDWFGEEVFTFEHQMLKELTPTEESSFGYENLKPTTPPIILNEDFKYRKL